MVLGQRIHDVVDPATGARQRRDRSLRGLVAGGAEPVLALTPIRTVEVELDEELPSLTSSLGGDENTTTYPTCRVLVRLHHHPVGLLMVDVSDRVITPEELGDRIWSDLAPAITHHLQQDRLIDEAADRRPAFPVAGACQLRVDQPEWTPLVSVIVCTFGRPRQLKAALEALLALDYPNYEVIVVDNGPEDPSTADLIRDEYSETSTIHYVAEPERGLSAARNRGMAVARGEVVAFTDDDIIVDRYWLAFLVSGFDAAGTVGCVTGLTLASQLETPAQIIFEQYGAFNRGYESLLFNREINPTGTLLYPYTAGVFGGGGNSAIRVDRSDDVLRFDRRLGPGSLAFGAEDLDMFLRVILRGNYIRYVPGAISWHEHRRSYEELRWQLFTYGAAFTALLTKWITSDVRVSIDLARMVPKFLAGSIGKLRSGSKPATPFPTETVTTFPNELRRLERVGFAYGPIAYFRSVRRERRTR
jgi:glycosyltransferase involved in cell wall biosynthesis